MRGSRSADFYKLFLIVLAGIAARAFTLWIGRPPFTGWLNHTYYYFVQVRGLLENGSLPYNDLPLLFQLDALLAKSLISLGVQTDAAIVASTRLAMCVFPALIPLPIHGILRTLNNGRELRGDQWVLVAVSAFPPLSLIHQPEFLQKNTLGLLLLTCLIFYTQRVLRRFDRRDALLAGLFSILIMLSHFGTCGAMALWGLSILLSYLWIDPKPRRIVMTATVVCLASVLSAGLIFVFDSHRFGRIFDYLASSIEGSLVAELLKGNARGPETLASLVGILLAYALLFFAHRVYSANLPISDARIFALANVLFCGLLLLPVVDQQLMGRLAVFAPVPLLVVLAHIETFGPKSPRLRGAVAVVAAGLVSVLALGEVVSSRIHNANHEAIFADIERLRAREPFGRNDLVVTRTGAEHVSNWFFHVKASVITSLNRHDFEVYDHVYVLNPVEGGQSLEGWERKRIASEADRYRFMRANILLPVQVEPAFASDNIEVFRLDGPPDGWVFDESGRWQGYSYR